MIAQITSVFRSACVLFAATASLGGCSWSEPVPAPRPESTTHRAVQSVGDVAARVALAQVGTPYRYGGSAPGGFDCSGLVQFSYARAGRSVPRTTSQLWQTAEPVGQEELRSGDILFFDIEGKIAHVGLYLGDGDFVHAPSTGRQVSVESLRSDFYRKAFVRAGRL